MKYLVLTCLALAMTACQAQQRADGSQDVKAIQSVYDEKLALELGADDYGMRQYVMVVLMTGPNDALITDPDKRAKIFKGHFDNITALAESGELVLAGPFIDPENIKRGLYIFDVKTVDEAKTLVLKDPAVEAGIFTPEFTPYYGSAALKMVNEVHQTLAKESPG